MYGGPTGEDPKYPGILSTVCVGCMYGGTTREDPNYPGILSIPDTVCVGMYGGTTREDPEYPKILSIPDTVHVGEYVRGDKLGGSQVSWGAFIDTVCMWRVHI